jgi:hypothetical protein
LASASMSASPTSQEATLGQLSPLAGDMAPPCTKAAVPAQKALKVPSKIIVKRSSNPSISTRKLSSSVFSVHIYRIA